MEEKKIISYKGFDKDLKCRGEQFVIGEEKSVKGKIEACENGYHACEEPLAVFGYYPPATSRYCVVEQSGDMAAGGDKIASRTIKVVKEIGIRELVEAQIEWVHEQIKYKEAIDKANASPDDRATGLQGAASATGFQGASSATGIGGIAVASGCDGRVMGAIGCAIVCCERGEWDGNTYPLLAVKAAIVDGEVLKPNTWYTLKGGEFVEV